ncbi:AAA family ATPase [Microbacterium sp. HMH0099]|uniref:AAA family ATPase n=1 Tax=Microbacterium sp. HMH0099 TaxID=3414026 RepID=UPI003BF71DED
MKLHRLELEGFGPFLEKQVVDLDAFADDGIFLITGRTGAGKSSVLDGICFALYGGVPRYDGADRRVRSDHCGPDDPTRVAVEFTAEGRRWRVTRSPEYERLKRRGGGMTKEAHRAGLEVLGEDGWSGVAARPVDVAAHLDEILGLTQQQFLQVILLAQNRFARFLLAKNDERQGLLRTLFGTRTFEQYERALDDRRKAAGEALAAEGGEVSTLLDEARRLADELTPDEESGTADGPAGDGAPAPSVVERLAQVVRGVERADYRVETLERERDDAGRLLDRALDREREARALRERQIERVRARSALAALDAETPEIVRQRAELEAANAAEALRAPLEAVERARRDEAAARAALQRAAADARALGELPAAEASGSAAGPAEEAADADDAIPGEELGARIDALTATVARCDEASGLEASASAAEADVRARERAVAEADGALAALAERRAAVPTMMRQLETRLETLAGAGARAEAARAAAQQLSGRLAAAREAERLAADRDQAELTALVRADELQQAVQAWAALLRRRLAGAAGELARDLVPGEPCAVCGSREHPEPADHEAAPVTDAEIAAAERRKDSAAEADRLASDAARVARDAHALAAARAGGESVPALVERLDEATALVDAATAEVAEEGRVRAEHRSLTELDAAAAAESDRLAAELVAQRQELALAVQRAEAARSGLDEARGGFPTVAARRADAVTRRDGLRALADAGTDLRTRVRARAEAGDDLSARLAGSPFDDASEATAALRDAAERRRLDTRVRTHESAERAARQRLLELELALVDEPDEPVDLTPVVAAVAAARAEASAATAAHAAAASAAARLRDLAQRADAGHDAVARLSEEHAVIARLANTVAGRAPNTHRMTLETFVLAAELEEIVVAANLRLEHMSGGRYRLQHTDALAARGAASGLGLEVMDAFTGQCRPPQSLSGGETFLASLALALGLAEVVTARAGGIRLDTLFIDEGFGSLDDETLDLALRTLDELRQGGRTVGVISHVAAMKDQLPAHLRVSATPRGPSIIRQDAAALV